MKKIISILIIAFIYNAATAQVADTTAYLRDSIVGKKLNYIGKPLRILLLDLKVKPTCDNAFIQYEPTMEKDTVNLARIDFNFGPILKMIQYPNLYPTLLIRFSAIKTPCIAFKPGNTLGWLDPWTDQKQTYYMQPAMVVTDISLY